jgi:CBS domain-containing protein
MTTPRPERPVSTVMSWPVASIDHEATLAEVIDALAADSIGAVLVLREGGLAGILSERDVVTHLAAGADPEHLLAGEAMVPDLVTVQGSESILEAARVMVEADARRGRLAGRGRRRGHAGGPERDPHRGQHRLIARGSSTHGPRSGPD